MFNNKRNTTKRASSYDSGKASIIVKTKIETPLRSSSLYNPFSQEVLQLQQQIKPNEEFEEVELVDDTSSNSSTSSNDSEDDELSLSAAEVAASVRSSRIITNEKPLIIINERKSNHKKQNRLSRLIFGWRGYKSNKKASPTPLSSVTTISQEQEQEQQRQQQKKSSGEMYDDGREELLYRGIRVKELRTTLHPMILPLDTTMTQPQILQRPEFARLNY